MNNAMNRGTLVVRGILFSAALLPQLGCLSSNSWLSNPLARETVASSKDELPPDKAIETCLVVARQLEKNNQEAAAMGQYERVVRLAPENWEATHRLAVLYDRHSEFAKADELYRKLTKMRPRNADVYNDWGYSYYERNNWQEAERQLRRALEIDPGNRRARNNLGKVLGQQGQYEEAYAAFKEVVGEADAHANMAFVYWTQNKDEEARRECNLAQKLDPMNQGAQKIMAQLDKPSLTPEERQALASKGGDSKRERQRKRALDAVAAAKATGGPLQQASVAPTTGTQDAGAGQPVYRSPDGTAWIAKPPAPSAESGMK